MPWWQYCLLVAYPGLSLGLLRAFTEHRAAEDSQERTASVESNVLFGLLYLYNNLHDAHHLKPAMPWYDIPRYYRANRVDLLKGNAHFVYRGYAQLAKRYLFVPVFSPVHPLL
jgi:fatty acid desaturase